MSLPVWVSILALAVAYWQARLATRQFERAQQVQTDANKRRQADDLKSDQREKQQATATQAQVELAKEQTIALQSQVIELKKSSDRAKQSADDARKVQQSGQRAYLVLESVKYELKAHVTQRESLAHTQEYEPGLVATFRNIGMTPASTVRAAGETVWATTGTQLYIPTPHGDEPTSAVPAGGTFTYTQPLGHYLPGPPRDVTDVNLVLLLGVQYEDVFRTPLSAAECRVNIIARKVQGSFYPCFNNFKIDYGLSK